MDIRRVHHIGIRVRDRDRALGFYAKLGFRPVYEDPHDPVVVAVNGAGVEINFIVNAAADAPNILMDVPVKHAGYTHVALGVGSVERALADLAGNGIKVSEGPVQLGNGVSIFVRDPDGNVLELREDPDA